MKAKKIFLRIGDEEAEKLLLILKVYLLVDLHLTGLETNDENS